MYLDAYEEKVLDGEYGLTQQRAMQLIVNVGEAYGAKKLINVEGSHLISWEAVPGVKGKILLKMLREMTDNVTVKIPTTTNPLMFNVEDTIKMGVPINVINEVYPNLSELEAVHKRIGATPCYTCSPHFVFNVKKNDHLALTESAVVIFANSWQGVRTNMEGGLTALASAILGKTPEYGMHISENRYGKIVLKIGDDLRGERFDYSDYKALDYFAGKMIADKIPIYEGLTVRSPDCIKYMGSHIFHSSAPMIHIIGVTPEARTIEEASGGEKIEDKISVGKKELENSYSELSTATTEKIEAVCFGCPHCSIREIKEIADNLKGKKIHKNVKLWIATSSFTKSMAQRMGLIDIIQKAGGTVISDMCISSITLTTICRSLGIETIATNSLLRMSGKYRQVSRHEVKTHFGNMEKCIDAAIKGKWL